VRNKHSGRIHGEEKPSPISEGKEHRNVPGGLRHWEKCAEALARLRWPSVFKCPSCGCAKHCRLERRDLRQCAECGRQTSVTAGTLFDHTKLPLATWFQAIFLITQGKKGILSMDSMRKIGVSYNAALAHEAQDHADDD